MAHDLPGGALDGGSGTSITSGGLAYDAPPVEDPPIPPIEPTRCILPDEEPRFRLVLRWAGRRWEFTDQIAPTWSETVTIGSGGPPAPAELPVTLDLGVDVAELVAEGHDLSEASGELYLDGHRVLWGRAVAPVYGDPTEPTGIVRLTLRQSVVDDSALYPPATFVVDPKTWPNAPESSMGAVYPIPYGAPGAEHGAGSPGVLLEESGGAHQYVLVSGLPVLAGSVRLIAPERDIVDDLPILHVADGRGQQVAVVDVLGTAFDADEPIEDGVELWVRWTSPARSGRAGDVVSEMLALTSGRIDLARTAIAREQLNGYELAFFLGERCRPIEWLGDNVLDVLPMTLVQGPDGLYPAVWRHLTERDAVAHLVIGAPDVVATSPIRYVGEPCNDYTLRYGVRADTGDYLATAHADQTTHHVAERSVLRYRSDVHDGVWAEEQETDVVDDPGTAERIAHERVTRYALRQRTLSVWVDRGVWGRIRAGDPITIADPARRLSRTPAWVETRADDLDGMSLVLVLQET